MHRELRRLFPDLDPAVVARVLGLTDSDEPALGDGPTTSIDQGEK